MLRRWMIGRSGKRGSEISVLAAWHNDDDDYNDDDDRVDYYYNNRLIVEWLEFSPMIRETWVQSQVCYTKDFKNGTWYLLV